MWRHTATFFEHFLFNCLKFSHNNHSAALGGSISRQLFASCSSRSVDRSITSAIGLHFQSFRFNRLKIDPFTAACPHCIRWYHWDCWLWFTTDKQCMAIVAIVHMLSQSHALHHHTNRKSLRQNGIVKWFLVEFLFFSVHFMFSSFVRQHSAVDNSL